MSLTRTKPALLRDVMTTDVATCTPHATLAEAAHLMWEHDCGCIPVLGEDRSVVGMLTDRDVCMGAYMTGSPLDALTVERSMTADVETCLADETVEEALDKMERCKVRRLPIVDADRRLAGIVSMADIARLTPRAPAGRDRSTGLLRTFAGICSPHPSFEDTSHQETVHV